MTNISCIAQHHIFYPRSDDSGLRRIEVPPTIDRTRLLQETEAVSQSWDAIRVSVGEDWLYDIELNSCHTYLSSKLRGLESISLCEFVNKSMHKDGGQWRRCVQFHNAERNGLEALIQCIDKTGPQTFALVRRSDGAQQRLDPDEPSSEGPFYVATILSRIVGRRLELEEFKKLQGILTGSRPKQGTTPELSPQQGITSELMWQLGRLLLALRCKISCLALPRDGYEDIDEGDEFTPRVRRICKTLYFYFFLDDRPRRSTGFAAPETWNNSYAHTDPGGFTDARFPTDESFDGFERWMQEG